MARTRRSELAAGVFVIAGAAIIFAVVIWLGGVAIGGRHTWLQVPAERGDTSLAIDSIMKIGSTEVGKVDRIVPGDHWKEFFYRIRLSEDVDLRQDAEIMVVAPMLGGTGSLSVLNVGSPDSPPADRDHPASLATGGLMDRAKAITADLAVIMSELKDQFSRDKQPNLLSNASDTVATLREMAETLNRQIETLQAQMDPNCPEGLIARANRTLVHIESATADTAGLIATVRPDAEQAVASAAKVMAQVQTYADADIAEVLKSIRATADQLLDAMTDLRTVAATARQLATVNSPNVDAMVANLTEVSVQMKSAAREIRRHPWRLLGKPDVQDVRTQNISVAADAFADAAAQLDDAVIRLQALGAAAEGPLSTDDPRVKQIRLKIKDSFQRYSQAEQALWEELAK